MTEIVRSLESTQQAQTKISLSPTSVYTLGCGSSTHMRQVIDGGGWFDLEALNSSQRIPIGDGPNNVSVRKQFGVSLRVRGNPNRRTQRPLPGEDLDPGLGKDGHQGGLGRTWTRTC